MSPSSRPPSSKPPASHFAHANHHALDDPRVHVLLQDGRNVLLVGSDKYDVITVELSSIWFAGAANLYNREFYQIAKKRLTEGGILQQWVQLHHTTPREIAGILATLRLEFPHLAFFVTEHQGHVVASQEPLVTRMAHLEELEAIPRVRAALGPNESLLGFARGIVFDDQSLDQLIHDAGAVTDEHHLDRRQSLSRIPDARGTTFLGPIWSRTRCPSWLVTRRPGCSSVTSCGSVTARTSRPADA